MPWISRSKYDALSQQVRESSLWHAACHKARRDCGKLANTIHRQRCLIRKLKSTKQENSLEKTISGHQHRITALLHDRIFRESGNEVPTTPPSDL